MVASVFFALSAALASEVGYTGKVVDQTRLAPDSLISPIPVFHGRFLSVETSRTTVRSLGVLILLFFAVTSPHHFCSAANMALDPLGSVGRVLPILGC